MKKQYMLLLKSLLASANRDELEHFEEIYRNGGETHDIQYRIKLIEDTYKELEKRKYEDKNRI